MVCGVAGGVERRGFEGEFGMRRVLSVWSWSCLWMDGGAWRLFTWWSGHHVVGVQGRCARIRWKALSGYIEWICKGLIFLFPPIREKQFSRRDSSIRQELYWKKVTECIFFFPLLLLKIYCSRSCQVVRKKPVAFSA